MATQLSEDLQHILEQADGRGVAIGKVMETLRGRGLDVLVILLALPFCTPIPLPGWDCENGSWLSSTPGSGACAAGAGIHRELGGVDRDGSVADPFLPTLEGQYAFKNLVLIAAGLVIGGTVRRDSVPRSMATAAGRPPQGRREQP
jgi:hypothetical protein